MPDVATHERLKVAGGSVSPNAALFYMPAAISFLVPPGADRKTPHYFAYFIQMKW